MPALNLETVRDLVNIEYEFVAITVDIETLADRLRALPVPGGTAAARMLRGIQTQLQTALAKIDGPISDAVRAFEEMNHIDTVGECFDENAPPW